VAERGIGFVDAPISGGPPAARARSLAVLAGGEPAEFKKVEPVLRSFGDNIFHLGPVGSGSLAKLCNQILTSVHQALACEVMVLGTKGGLDPARLYQALSVSSGQSRGMDRAIARFVLPRRFSAKATIELILKDLERAMQAAAGLGVEQSLAPVAAGCTGRPWPKAMVRRILRP
jgi:3-hydroxyisobutyrate dehydrogenase-like beta-hydroxyacid dehydrogenase